jgi:nucleoside-diphosphate-sugar epimerase
LHIGGYNFLAASRNSRQNLPYANGIITSLSDDKCISSLLAGVSVVIHAAARAHIKGDKNSNPIEEYRCVNVDGTHNLARQAAAAGVKRFIFLSSIGVNGNSNFKPFAAGDPAKPADPYAQSKWEAEQVLWKVQQDTGMEIVIIRPPLVYGPSAPGNFGSLVRWVERGVPLPLGAINNKRSLIGIDNLIDLIVRCVDHPYAANQVFLAGDGEDLSTTELLRKVGHAMGRSARLVPVPTRLLHFGAALVGKKAVAQRLLGSLQVDISKTCDLLEWKPPYTLEEGLRRCFPKSH